MSFADKHRRWQMRTRQPDQYIAELDARWKELNDVPWETRTPLERRHVREYLDHRRPKPPRSARLMSHAKSLASADDQPTIHALSAIYEQLDDIRRRGS
jgi:hypothetical protein